MMKLSMEIIADKLSAFAPKRYITAGDMTVSGARLLKTAESIRRDIVYIASADSFFEDARLKDTVVCAVGADWILLTCIDENEALAAILDIFEEFDEWESALREAVETERDMQHFIDISRHVLPYPIFLTDALGNVVGYSREYGINEVDIFWDSIVLHGKTHDRMFSGSLTDSRDRAIYDWDIKPGIYNTPQRRIIGLHLLQNGETIGAMVIIEQALDLTAGTCQIAGFFRDALSQAAYKRGSRAELRTAAAIARDYLDGKSDGKENLWEHIRSHTGDASEELELILLRNINRADFNYKSNVSHRLSDAGIRCFCMPYRDYIMAITAKGNDAAFLSRVRELLYGDEYLCGVSMPFSDVSAMPDALSQAMLALKIGDKNPCAINKCVDYAYVYLLSQLSENTSAMPGLLHPALSTLKKYDEKHQTSLYNTLYEYLRLERNVVAAAKCLFIHRNSMLYRLQRIEKLLELDFTDINTRMYLLLSFHIDMTPEQTAENGLFVRGCRHPIKE